MLPDTTPVADEAVRCAASPWPRLTVALMAVLLSVACDEAAMRPPPAPNYDGSVTLRPPPPSGRPDGGSDGGDGGDGALPDASRPTGCVEVTAPDSQNRATVTQDGSLVELPVRAAYARWDTDDCDSPTLALALTDGACAPAPGWQLRIAIDRGAIGTSVSPGVNLLMASPFDDLLRVRYVVATGLEEPDVWGSCEGAAGSITFSALGDSAGAPIAATFSMTLTDCGVPATFLPLSFDGAISVVVPEAFESACPPS